MEFSPSPRLSHDIWTSHLRGRSLVLGGDDLFATQFLAHETCTRCPTACPAHARCGDPEGCLALRNTKRCLCAASRGGRPHACIPPEPPLSPDFDVDQNLVYAGSRNGAIKRFDGRTRAPGPNLLGDVFLKSSNSITYLNIIKDWQLLVSTIRGAVRFSRDRRFHLKNSPYSTPPVRPDRDIRYSLPLRDATAYGVTRACQFIPT